MNFRGRLVFATLLKERLRFAQIVVVDWFFPID